MCQCGKPLGWVLSLALASACSDPAPNSPVKPDPSTETVDALPPTAKTLVGEVDAHGDANLAWVRTLPGEMASPPEVARGPGNELIVLLTAERRPLGTKRFVDDVLLLRLDADTGALGWLKIVDPGAKLAVDTHGSIILAWPTRITKLDADGKLLWDKPRQAESDYELLSLAVDSNDDLLLARLELDHSPGKVDAEDPKGFVELEKLDAMGSPVWSSRFGHSTSYLEAVWVTVDSANNPVLLAGGLKGPFDFGGGALEDEDVVAKYDADGNHVFSKAFGGYGPVGYQASSPVLADADGNILVRTESVGDIDVGLGSFFCGHQYVIKLDPAGNAVWNICTPAETLTLMPDGGFVATARLRRDIELGEQQCAVNDSPQGSEAELTRYDADANWIATQCAADPGYQYPGAVASDSSGAFFMTAAFTVQLSLPGGHVADALDQSSTALVAKVTLPAP